MHLVSYYAYYYTGIIGRGLTANSIMVGLPSIYLQYSSGHEEAGSKQLYDSILN